MSMDITIRVFSPEQLDLLRKDLTNGKLANRMFIESYLGKSQKKMDQDKALLDAAHARINAFENLLDQLPKEYLDGETYPKGKR